MRKEAERLKEVELSVEEMQAAKNKLLGQYALGKQTNAEIVQIFGWYETLGLGFEFDTQFQAGVKQVSASLAQEVAQCHLTEPHISIVGPQEAIAQVEG
ncbi:MAG: insulinase family protein [Okeania sp. SIO2D1]|nr:insulinase family protein [Okeania sp. SIO2D1]